MPTSQITAILGFPLKHSLSPQLHADLYRRLKMDAQMIKLEEPDIAHAVVQIKAKNIVLTAVTIPHKQAIMKYLDMLDPVAEKIGAVNTVIQRDHKLVGYNTDVVGIAAALEGIDLKGKKVLMCGAGGAAQPVAFFAKTAGAEIYYYNRTLEKAQQLAEKFPGTILKKTQLVAALPIDIIINTTPVGMFPHIDESPLPLHFIKSHHIVFDLIYNPVETLLLRQAKKVGAKTVSGLPMFIAQAVEQVRLWTGQTPSSDDLEKHLITLIS